MTDDNRLPIWTVYDHPTDYPDHYVARLFLNDAPTPSIIMSSDLEMVRAQLIEIGLVKLMRHPNDDPKIIETWL